MATFSNSIHYTREIDVFQFQRKSRPFESLGRISFLKFPRQFVKKSLFPSVFSSSSYGINIRHPTSILDISNGDHILGFGADLAKDHPGFSDEKYKNRRSQIADMAISHRVGDLIPHLEYNREEIDTWRQVYTNLIQFHEKHACAEYLMTRDLFQFSPEIIPQLQDVSDMLSNATGWQIRPVAGLLHPRDFLNGLAFKYFHSTQYVRHVSNPMYTPEPDICHEIIGHVPLLANQDFADMATLIGQASLGASESDIWRLTKLYWYTVEFGVIKQEGEWKALGAGILSSSGEMQWMTSGQASFCELNPWEKLPRISYKDGFQKTYFGSENLPALVRVVHTFCNELLHAT